MPVASSRMSLLALDSRVRYRWSYLSVLQIVVFFATANVHGGDVAPSRKVCRLLGTGTQEVFRSNGPDCSRPRVTYLRPRIVT